ncbi:MAG: hypothetical protein M3O70_21685 [Actinomycetota bacterium]|nr:hypothetical protein [Actinomycetota bacterium]
MFATNGHMIFSRRRLGRSLPRRALIAAVAVGLFAVTALPGPATAHVDGPEQPDAAVGEDCDEFVSFPDVPYTAAAALVPASYRRRVWRDDFGNLKDPDAETSKLFVVARRCKTLKVGGKAVPDAIDSYIAVILNPPDPEHAEDEAPHPSGVTPGDPTVSPIDETIPLDTYLVQWATNNQPRATWLRSGTGLEDEDVTVINDLVFDYKPADGTFTFKVPARAPSPYTIQARVSQPSGTEWYAGQNQWWEAKVGTVIIFAVAPVAVFGSGEGTITSDDAHSPLGRTFGNQQTRATGIYADRGIPVDPFSMAFYGWGEWTKCVRNDTNPCTPDDH